MSTSELEAKATQYRALQAEIKQLQEQAEAVKADLITVLDAQKADSLAAGPFTVRYTVYESTRVNTAALKNAGLYDQYSTKVAALRFSVS